MKKFLGILFMSLLFCGDGFAGKTKEKIVGNLPSLK
jgi:hypothetical protein